MTSTTDAAPAPRRGGLYRLNDEADHEAHVPALIRLEAAPGDLVFVLPEVDVHRAFAWCVPVTPVPTGPTLLHAKGMTRLPWSVLDPAALVDSRGRVSGAEYLATRTVDRLMRAVGILLTVASSAAVGTIVARAVWTVWS